MGMYSGRIGPLPGFPGLPGFIKPERQRRVAAIEGEGIMATSKPAQWLRWRGSSQHNEELLQASTSPPQLNHRSWAADSAVFRRKSGGGSARHQATETNCSRTASRMME